MLSVTTPLFAFLSGAGAAALLTPLVAANTVRPTAIAPLALAAGFHSTSSKG
jgi:phosphoribosylcarboxyaminoimidazole (NCAIR) mutase